MAPPPPGQPAPGDSSALVLSRASSGHSARPVTFPLTERSHRCNVSTSHRRSLRELQFPHRCLVARLLTHRVEKRVCLNGVKARIA